MRRCGVILAVLMIVFSLAQSVYASRQDLSQATGRSDVNRVIKKIEGQPTEIILNIPEDFCGIAWGTTPENTGLKQTPISEQRLKSGEVYSAVCAAEIDVVELLGAVKPNLPTEMYYQLDKKNGLLGLDLVAVSFSGEDTVRSIEKNLTDKYGCPSVVEPVQKTNDITVEYRWHGMKTSIKFCPSNDWRTATIVICATNNLDP